MHTSATSACPHILFLFVHCVLRVLYGLVPGAYITHNYTCRFHSKISNDMTGLAALANNYRIAPHAEFGQRSSVCGVGQLELQEHDFGAHNLVFKQEASRSHKS